jgi:HEAT repeat protein
LICAIISHLPEQSDTTRQTLLMALRDQTDGIRWQAALAIGKTEWNDAQSLSALQQALGDGNQFVGGVAAYSLARLGATNSAPLLLTRLETALATTNTPIRILEQQSQQITRDMRGEENHALNVLDPDGLETRMYVNAEVNANVKRMAAMRLPPRPFNLPMQNYDLPAWLIEALGDLKYTPAAEKLFRLRSTDYEAVALAALRKVAPERLFDDLLTTAKDKQTDSYVREKALVTLSHLSATNHVRDLAPLLDDTTPIVYSRPLPGDEWRICDRAAVTISVLLGWEHGLVPVYYRAEQREEMMKRAREWAKASP